MNTKSPILIRKMLFLFFLVALLVLFWSGMVESPVVRAEAGDPTVTPEPTSEYFTSTTITLEDGRQIEGITIHGPPQPPVGYERATVSLPYSASAQGVVTLSVPAFDWSFGCSATSGSMIAAYYDRNGYPNMYTGLTGGGVMPMDSSSWQDWTDGNGDTYGQCPLTASRNGLDSRMTRGSTDDYWVSYLSGVQDPFITNGWAEHTWGDAIGDYMKTSQSNYGNDDGSTTFYTWTNNRGQLTCNDMVTNGITEDGTYGRKLFYEAKGYTVMDCYNQKTDNNKGDFTFALYMAEIDAGRPVMLNLAGHTVVGVGYDNSTNTVYIHDTWDYLTHTMTWGGSYSDPRMKLQSVSIVNLVSLNTYTLSVSKSGTGSGTVTSSPGGINCGSTCSATFNNNTSVTLTAVAGTGSTFTGWSGSGCSGTGTCTVTMDAARSVSATFTNQAPNQPVLVQPADNATGITLPPKLQVTVSDPNADAMNVTFYGRAAGGGTGDDFRIVIFPDTQNESQYYPAVYTSQTTWIANNKATQNIVFATHVGDIVNTASSTTEWGNADTSMDILDTGNVFYSVGPGNHDLGGLYNNYFGIARFSAKTYYGGYYGSDNYNNYSLFSASGRDFILINLQYNPTTAMLDWADARLKQYATRRGIVVSHSILNIDNSFTSEGTTIFNALKDNANLFLMLCGHMHSASDGAAYLAQLGDDGHTIHIMEADYQDYPSGGNGYLRILRFSPLDDKIYATTYSPYISAYITSSPDQMEMAYDMAGSAAFAVIGTANGVASGSNASISWTGLANGTRYDWFAVANDGITSTTSSTWGFTTMNPMIIVNDFANYRVFQRDIGGMSKSITISGTYSNMTWSRMEARVLAHGTSTAVVDWTTIDSTPGGGTFSGSLTVPQGGWYNVEIRAIASGGAVIGSSRGTNKWGVGMIILVIGQSNMSGRGQPPFTAAASDLAVNYNNAGTWEHLADPYDDESPANAVDYDSNAGGSMIPGIANSLLQTFDFPIAFVPAAKGGSNLYVNGSNYGWAYRNPSNHYDTSTLYGQSITKAQSVGGVELIIMHQGEADLSGGRTEAQYEADFATMIGNYRQDLHSGIPILICQLGTVGDGTDAGVVGIRSAQHDVDNGTDIFIGTTAMELPRIDTWHYNTPALTVIGTRLANAIEYYFGRSNYYRGPFINSAFFSDVNRNKVNVTLNHRGGTDITPATGITGFEVFDNGSSVTIQSAARYAADAVQLTLSTPISSGHTVTLRYLYGMLPVVSGLVKDNSALALPLENTTGNLTVLNTYTLNVSKSGGGSGTVTSSPAGINCGSTCSASFNYNTSVTLTAVASTGSTFTGWSGGGCSGTGTCTVTMTAVTSVTANFTLNTYSLSVSKSGTGSGTVTSSPAGINCGSTCSASFNYSTSVTLTAVASTGSTFTGWSGSGCSGTGTCTVTITAATSVTANFTLNTYALSVSKTGTGSGTVTSSPSGVNCGSTCSYAFNYNTVVTLTAAPLTGSTFTGWSGGGCSDTGTCIVTLTAATSVTANFTLNTYTLSVSKSGTGSGTVTSSPAGISCGSTCSYAFAYNTVVTLTASPTSNFNRFVNWGGDAGGSSNPIQITMTQGWSVTAMFEQTTFTDVPYDYSETLGGISYPLHGYIQALYNGGYTAGCLTNPLRYCPTNTFKRDESAVFMLRGNFGGDYGTPANPLPPATGTLFADMTDVTYWDTAWAEAMFQAGLTAGCQYPADNPVKSFCPSDQLPRDQASVFALRLKYGVSYGTPANPLPAATGTLLADMTDVNYWGTAWAEKAYLEGLLPECGTQSGKPLFCPNDPVDRAWAAYMIVKAKNLPLP